MPARRNQGIGLSPRSESRLPVAGLLAASPWQMMRRMQEDMDRIFGQVLSDGGALSPAAGGGAQGAQQLAPSMDISEDGKEWRIEVDLPGVKPDDVDVRLQDHHLILRAEIRPMEQEERREEGERRYLRQERRYGFIETVLPLPENVEEDAIRSEFHNGVLTVHLPKSQQQKEQGRRIPVGQEAAPQARTTAQSQTGQSQLGQSQLGQSQSGQGQPGQGQTAQGQTGQGQPGQGQPGQGQPGQGQTARDRAGQGQTARDRAAARGSHDAGQDEEAEERQTASAGSDRGTGQTNRS